METLKRKFKARRQGMLCPCAPIIYGLPIIPVGRFDLPAGVGGI